MAELTIQQALDQAIQHHRAGRLAQAERIYREILARQANQPKALHLLGIVAAQVGRSDAAVDLIGRAVALCPDDADMHSDYGNALTGAGRLDEAIAAQRRAIALRPDFPEAHANLGRALLDQGEVDAAVAAYRQAIALNPHYPEAHYSLGMSLLLRGEFAPGWEECEWRCRARDFASPHGEFPQPRWDGRPLSSPREKSRGTLLLHAEYGLGDTIQFVRYLPLVAQRIGHGQVVLECQPELVRLFSSLAAGGSTMLTAGGSTMLTAGCQLVAQGQPLPAFDLHCPLLSLPRIFGSTLENLPREVPYLC